MTASTSSLFHRVGRAAPCVGILLVLLLLSAVPATAHKVNVFAWVDGDRIYTQSKFSGGRKAKNATIEVYDRQGNKLLEGQTDDKGEFSFKIPQKTLKTQLIQFRKIFLKFFLIFFEKRIA